MFNFNWKPLESILVKHINLLLKEKNYFFPYFFFFYFSFIQSKLYVSVDNKKYALDLECKFTDKSVMLKRDLWRDENCYKMDISYQIKMIGKCRAFLV